ncbi:unnamed protein product [marine sediment metagenome]|uniref:Uncharacterized protein n=1 Tax=marine sediment metagenome TaxID=412755 RepID=X0TPW2_9ZZZZ
MIYEQPLWQKRLEEALEKEGLTFQDLRNYLDYRKQKRYNE